MKRIFIYSDNKDYKKGLIKALKRTFSEVEEFDYSTSSNRSETIHALSLKEYHAIVIDCTLPRSDLPIILKYLSTNDYYFCHIYFLSDDFTLFDEIIQSINFPHLYLLSMPVDVERLADKISSQLFPFVEKIVDTDMRINLDFLKVFIDCTKKILSDFCLLGEVHHERPYIKTQKNKIDFALIGEIVLKSEFFEGNFKIGFTKDVYLKLINNVLMIDADEITDESVDFASELVNMIYGQAKNILNDQGHNFLKIIPRFDLNPPNIISKYHTIVVPIIASIGTIYIEVEVISVK